MKLPTPPAPLPSCRTRQAGEGSHAPSTHGPFPFPSGVVCKLYMTKNFPIAVSPFRHAPCNSICVNAPEIFAPRTLLARIYR